MKKLNKDYQWLLESLDQTICYAKCLGMTDVVEQLKDIELAVFEREADHWTEVDTPLHETTFGVRAA